MDTPRDYHTKWTMISLVYEIFLKNDTNELKHKPELDPQTQKTYVWKGEQTKFGINKYVLLYIKYITRGPIM